MVVTERVISILASSPITPNFVDLRAPCHNKSHLGCTLSQIILPRPPSLLRHPAPLFCHNQPIGTLPLRRNYSLHAGASSIDSAPARNCPPTPAHAVTHNTAEQDFATS